MPSHPKGFVRVRRFIVVEFVVSIKILPVNLRFLSLIKKTRQVDRA